MKTLLTLTALTLCACGVGDYECNYKYSNICFDTEFKVDQNQVAAMILIIEDELLVDYPDTVPFSTLIDMIDVHVKMWDAKFAYNCEPLRPRDPLTIGPEVYVCDGYNSGVNKWGEYIDVQYEYCLASSALPHELLHTWEDHNDGMRLDHLTPYLFTEYSLEYDLPYYSSAEARIHSRMRKEIECE